MIPIQNIPSLHLREHLLHHSVTNFRGPKEMIPNEMGKALAVTPSLSQFAGEVESSSAPYNGVKLFCTRLVYSCVGMESIKVHYGIDV